jgi:hypothetical protein
MTTIRSKVTAAFDKLAAKQPDAIQTGAIRRTERAGGGPSDPDGGTVTTTDYPARMAVFEAGADRIDGTNIVAGDLQVIVEPISIEVTTEDQVICDRGTLSIVQLGRVASGGETALYDMLCRGPR